MNKKVMIGSVVGGVVAFFLGWVIFGMLLSGFYKANMTVYEGLMIDPPNMVGIAIGNLMWCVLLAVLFNKMGIADLVQGAIWGGLTFFLVMGGMDLFFWASMNLYSPMGLAVDVVANTCFGAIMGAVIAFVMSKIS